MNQYKKKTKCTKCGCRNIHDYYCKGETFMCMGYDNGSFPHYQKPAIHRRCKNCSHVWLEAPLDAQMS